MTTDIPKSRMRLGLRILLIASLALNVMIVGVVAGGIMKGRSPGPFGGFDMTIGPFAEALGDDDRRAIRAELRDRRDIRPPRYEDRIAAMEGFLDSVRAENFDPSAIEAMFAEQRARASNAMEAGQQALLNRITAMDNDERARFAERLERELRHGGDRR
ncbi:periplasmic heavy metal sensor [Marivivens sp. JLT3646]|uniref:periplasmic heavy metal sensor n=1 Tax=Marivivens sp. JLT3646 TaxID=1920883 RepID=UPI0007FD2A37|nr:periplasmic heavy metal sensor [Marivivens sp. JLT3646]APO87104.1 hypothetical protein BSK21_08690 [Marivivens sp. JLT3646]OBR39829.1 hypothetical protein A9199_02375 [Donghicola sp. JL3646]